MRKILLTTIISTSLIFGFIPNSNSAQIESGSSCSKAGAVKSIGAQKLVCKKIGKKLIWTQLSGNTEKKPSTVQNEVQKENSSGTLTLLASIQPESILRLELVQDVYLGHCASFLVYQWGIWDSYEGSLYRQQKEYLIPINLNSKKELPLSFTIGCSGYGIQSFSFSWEFKDNTYSPTVTPLKIPVSKSKIKNSLPENFDVVTPGEIRVFLPKAEEVEKLMYSQDDGYFASQTSIVFAVNKNFDICDAKILTNQGIDVSSVAYGPGVSSTYNVASLYPSGFDRVNGIGFIAYRGSKREELELVISCDGSGISRTNFLHPAPVQLLNISENGRCPADYKNQILPSLKRPNIDLICKEDSMGVFTWQTIPKEQATQTSQDSVASPLSSAEINKMKAQVKVAQNLSMKTQKIRLMLKDKYNQSTGERFSKEKTAQIESLFKQAEEIISLAQKMSTLTSLLQVNLELSKIVKNFNSFETSSEELLGS